MPGLKRWPQWIRAGLLIALWISAAGRPACAQPAPGAPEPPPRGKPLVAALAIAPDQNGFLAGSQAGIRIVTFSQPGKRSFPTELEQVHALAFAPDGRQLAIAGGTPGEEGLVELRSWPGGKRLAQLDDHDDLVYDAAWLDDGKQLATASADSTIRIWDVATAQCAATIEGHSAPVLALAVAPDGKWLCSGSADATIRVWEMGTWKPLRALNNHLGPVQALAVRPARDAGRPATLASASSDATVRIWQPALGRMVRIVRLPAPATCVAWSPDGTRLIAGARDGIVRIIDGDSDAILAQRRLSDGWNTALAVSSDGRLVAGDSAGATHVVADLLETPNRP